MGIKLEHFNIPNISTKQIPKELVLLRQVASLNNPDQLEQEDVAEFFNGIKLDPKNNRIAYNFFRKTFLLADKISRQEKLPQKDIYLASDAALKIFIDANSEGNPYELDEGEIAIFREGLNWGAQTLYDQTVTHHEILARRVGPFVDDSVIFKDNRDYQAKIREAVSIQQNAFFEFDQKFGISADAPSSFSGLVVIEDAFEDDISDRRIIPTQQVDPHMDSEIKANLGQIRIDAQKFMKLGPKTIKHELNHAWLLKVLGPDNYRRVPAWFREGLAMYSADQDKSSMALVENDPWSLFKFTKPRNHNFSISGIEYYGARLAVEVLIKDYGAEIIGKILEKVKDGQSFHKAISSTIKPKGIYAHQDFGNKTSFYAYLRKEAVLILVPNDANGIVINDYKKALGITSPEALKYFDDRDIKTYAAKEAIRVVSRLDVLSTNRDEIENAWEEFLEKHPESPFTPLAIYLLATMKRRKAQPDEAKQLYTRLREYDGQKLDTRLYNEAIYFSIVLGDKTQDEKKAKMIEALPLFTTSHYRNKAIQRFNL